MHTYQAAVCDDDAAVLETLCCLCREIFTEEGISYKINTFSSAQALQEKLDVQSDPFDLLILDIQMEGMTGMELAKSLRDRGNRVSILFITACDDYLSEGYSVQPIHFLLKPVKKEALANALRTDLKLNYLPKALTLHIGSKTVSLPLSDIRYIESSNHEAIVQQTETKRMYSVSLSEIERQIPPGQFCRCHNSYLVNLGYVQEIDRKTVYLRSGEILPVGRAYYKSFQEMFIRYLNQ